MNTNIKNWVVKNGLPLLGLGLTMVSTLVNNKNSDKKMEETITKRVNEVLADKMKGS